MPSLLQRTAIDGMPRHLSACLTLGGLALSSPATFLSPNLATLHGHSSSLSHPTHHPFTGSLQTPTPPPSQNPHQHPTLRPYLPRARIYSIGSTRLCFLFTAEQNKAKAFYRLRDKADGRTSKHPIDIDCGQSRLEHGGGYQRKCHVMIVPAGYLVKFENPGLEVVQAGWR
jgi:hypothetical protein